MELKWLEDFISVANKGHFAKASEQRYVSQSALTRHIKSLELWVGTELLDRSHHPIQLTKAGKEFYKLACEITRLSFEAKATAREFDQNSETNVTIASLHTLTLFYIPQLVAQLQQELFDFETTVIAEKRTIEDYLLDLSNGGSDFFICYTSSSSHLQLDEGLFPRIDIGIENVKPYQKSGGTKINLDHPGNDKIPYLAYSGTSFMNKIVSSIIDSAPFYKRLNTVYKASLAEGLFTAAQNNLGLAWLPDNIMYRNTDNNSLRLVSDKWGAAMNITVFKSVNNHRPIVEKIWNYWKESIRIFNNN